MKKFYIFVVITFSIWIWVPIQACLKILPCQETHEYSLKALTEVENDTSQANDDYLYDFCWSSSKSLMAHPQDIEEAILFHMEKATRYFELKNFEKCLEHIKLVDKQQSFHGINSVDRGKILAYKAYCKMYLKKYESAIDSFEDLIIYLINTDHHRPCLFATYFYHAFCVNAYGDVVRAKKKIAKLVDMELVNRNSSTITIYDQPCFHPNGVSESHLIKMAQDIAEATGYNILAANNQFYPTFSLCNQANESMEACSENCIYLAGIGSYAAAYIPNKHIQAAVLFSLVLFQTQCTKCCTDGLGSENCLKTLKTILKHTLNQEALDGL